MGVNNIRPGMGGGAKPPAYSPPAGTASGIPGASYPVMGSTPVTNMQPRMGNPGAAQMRPAMAPGMPPGAPPAPQGMPAAGMAPGARPGMPPPQMGAAPQANPQQLATALTQLGGGRQ